MNNNPLVSVVMPVFNKEKYVKQAIESVLNQTYRNLEIIIIDDKSADNSLSILENYNSIDKRIRLIKHSRNTGVALTRNDGILAAKGEYIALVDADDIWTKDKIAKQVNLMITQSADITYCSYGYISNDGDISRKAFVVPTTTSFNKFLSKSVFSCSTIMYKSDIAKKYLFDNEYYHEDFVLWCKLLSNDLKAIGDKEILAYYRLTDDSKAANKITSAKHRWVAYRKNLKLPMPRAILCFISYSLNGLIKYF